MGYYRIGEDGRLYLTTKSAHYHTPLGHDFPGTACSIRPANSVSQTPHTTMPADILRAFSRKSCLFGGRHRQNEFCSGPVARIR